MPIEAEIFRVTYKGADWGSMNGVIGGARPEKGKAYELSKTAWEAASDDWVLVKETAPKKKAKKSTPKKKAKQPEG